MNEALVEAYLSAIVAVFDRHAPEGGKGWLYVFSSSPPPGVLAPVKVGYSDDIPKRRIALSTGFPWLLTTYGAFRGGGVVESKLHRALRDVRAPHFQGEWYDPEILTAFDRMPERHQRRFTRGETPEMCLAPKCFRQEAVLRCTSAIMAVRPPGLFELQALYDAWANKFPPDDVRAALKRLQDIGLLRRDRHGRRHKYRWQYTTKEGQNVVTTERGGT